VKRRRRRLSLALRFLPGLALTAAAPQALGQSQTGFAAGRYEPSERGGGWFVLDGLDLRGRARPSFGATLDYAYKPLIVYDTARQSERLALVRHQLYVHTGAAFVFADRLRVGLNVPVAVHQDGEPLAGAPGLSPADAPALGDVRLAADVRLTGEHDAPFTLAVGVRAWLPTGLRSQFTSDGSLRLAPQILVAGRAGVFAWASRGAVVYRARDDAYAGTRLGSEIALSLAAGVRVGRFLVGPEFFASTGLGPDSFFSSHATPADALVGLHYAHPSGLRVGAALGAGLTTGYGSPALRTLLSVAWGAPVPVAPPDRDGDGIPDELDACPDVPGAPSGDPELNGCPAPEKVLDEDTDGDGIPDRNDACPAIKGVPTTDPMTNGCPEGTPRQLAVVTRSEIRIAEQIQFATDSADLVGDSDAVLSAVKRILDEHPEILRVRVEGHTDAVGDPSYNDDLSARRAASVTRWLADHGVEASRLESAGFGSRRPLDSNETEQGRAKNRRVVFTILERAPVPP
jgi:outer membrane protein OmpA-like peptidoglycan-associated protein